jgi:hypothetical protein
MDLAGSGIANFDDPSRQVLANPGPLAQLEVGESRDWFGRIGHDIGTAPIGADFERIVAAQFEHVGDFAKDAGDAEVIECHQPPTAPQESIRGFRGLRGSRRGPSRAGLRPARQGSRGLPNRKLSRAEEAFCLAVLSILATAEGRDSVLAPKGAFERRAAQVN